MRADLVVFPMFLGTVFFAAISLGVSIKLAKAKVGRWETNSTAWFVMSVGNFGEKQIAFWRRKAGYSEEEANTIVRYQLLGLLGIVLGFFVSVILGMLMIS